MSKILISGRGGCGKSTVSSLIAKKISENKKVILIDGDESNLYVNEFVGIKIADKTFLEYLDGKPN